jgi:UDP-glucuronate decarboxylase
MAVNDGRVVSNFIIQALKNEQITIYGDGSQTRSFCYVEDLIEGFIRIMNSAKDISGPINLGNPNEFTMIELAEKVIKATGSKSTLKYETLPADDPKQRKPDISTAQRLLDWHPQISLDAGLIRTIEYFENKIK